MDSKIVDAMAPKFIPRREPYPNLNVSGPAGAARVMAETYDIPPRRTKDRCQLIKSIIDRATVKKPDRDPTPEELRKDPATISAASDELD